MSDLWLKMPLVYEPKKQNRFILRFPSDLGIQEWTVESASRPSIDQKPNEIPFLNSKTYVLGRFEWKAIQVKFRDAIGPSTAQAIMEWVRLHSESATARQGYAAGYKRNIELELLDPTGAVCEKWILVNCFLTSVNFGQLQYNTDDVLGIDCTIQMDYAILCY